MIFGFQFLSFFLRSLSLSQFKNKPLGCKTHWHFTCFFSLFFIHLKPKKATTSNNNRDWENRRNFVSFFSLSRAAANVLVDCFSVFYAVCVCTTMLFNNFQIHNLVMIWPTVCNCCNLQLGWTKNCIANTMHTNKIHCYWYNFEKSMAHNVFGAHAHSAIFIKIEIHIIIHHTYTRTLLPANIPQICEAYAEHDSW